jgi:hypothetical protein
MAAPDGKQGPGGAAALWLLFLLLVVAWTFRSALGFDFIAIDDTGNITLNPHMGPPGLWNLGWMFTDADYVRRYIPFGWLGFSVVYSAAGLSAFGFHAANLLLHLADSVLFLALLLRLLERWAPSADRPWSAACAGLAAALWAVHPLRGETIGWISGLLYEQAGIFALLSILAYLEAVALPAGSGRRWAWLVAAASAYLVSLLTYPIAIGLVAAFFLVDIADRRPMRVLTEKALLVLPAALAAGLTVALRFRSNAKWPAAASLADFPALDRVMQAFYVFGYYVWKSFWPTGLTLAPAQLYDFRPLAPAFVASAALVLGATAALAWKASWRRGPLLLWLAYLAMLVPFAGFTEHPHFPNDRYSFLPAMALSLALALLLSRVRRPGLRAAAAAASLLACAAAARSARAQLQNWRDDDAVYSRIISGTDIPVVRIQNYVGWAHAAANRGRDAEARGIMRRRWGEYPHLDLAGLPAAAPGIVGAPTPAALSALSSDASPEALGNMKIALEAAKDERLQEAEEHFKRCLEIAPDYRAAAFNYAMFLALHRRPADALHVFYFAQSPDASDAPRERNLLSVIAQSYWEDGSRGLARSALLLAVRLPGDPGGRGLDEELRRQAEAFGIQAFPALRASTIR